MDKVEIIPSMLDEIVEFVTTSPSLKEITEFELSEDLKQRSHYLFEQNRAGRISAEELDELDELLKMGHFVNMLKIRAREKLADI